MILARLTGACLLALAGYATGWYQTRRRRERLDALEQLRQMIALVQDEIQYRSAPLSDILIILKTQKNLGQLALAECRDLRNLPQPVGLDGNSWQQLQGFFSRLGSVGAREEVGHCAYYLNRCSALCRQAQQEYEQARQLYAKAGLGIGAMIALVLL